MRDAVTPEHASVADARLRRNLIAVVVLGALALILASGAIAVLVNEDRAATAWVNHTYVVEQRVSELRVAIARAETARRGYLITRSPIYVTLYERYAAPIMPGLAQVRALTSDNPRQQRASARLQDLLEAQIVEQRSSLQSIEAREAQDIRALVLAGQQQSQTLRDLLDGMTAEEERLLAGRRQRQAADSITLLVVAIGSALALVLLAAACYVLVRRYAADLDRSRSSLRRLNIGLEDEVARRTAELTRANTEIQRFAYIVSHDLRSPLVNVMGFTSEMALSLKPLRALLSKVEDTGGCDPAGREFAEARAAVEQDIPESLGFIRTSTQKMDRLINAILKLSREGRRTLTPEPIAMGALMTQIADTLKSQTEDKGADVEISPGLPDLVSDRVAVEQVLSNVLENALKYLKPGRPGRIVVRGRREPTAVVYEVEDNGRGIAPHDHERVFDLFRRAGVQDQPGEGIGLAHVRALVHRLGGNISVQSELDRGATFRISLPPVLIRSEENHA